MIERLWVEVNTRVNYPVKRILIEMENAGDINLADIMSTDIVSPGSVSTFLLLELIYLSKLGITILFQVTASLQML